MFSKPVKQTNVKSTLLLHQGDTIYNTLPMRA